MLRSSRKPVSVVRAQELREYDSLIKSIGECKSKSEEDRIILAEIETLKQRLNDPKLDKTRGREYMVRLIYCEMLGHDVSWAYVKAVQLASEPNILTKKVTQVTTGHQCRQLYRPALLSQHHASYSSYSGRSRSGMRERLRARAPVHAGCLPRAHPVLRSESRAGPAAR